MFQLSKGCVRILYFTTSQSIVDVCVYRIRSRGEGFLSTAMLSNDGDYPDDAVKERANLGKFFLVVLCMLPVSYCSWLPITNDVSSS